MINLNNTWCEATEEHEKALNRVGIVGFCADTEDTLVYVVNEDKFVPHSNSVFDLYPHLKDKQIHLVNGEFEYVTDTDVGDKTPLSKSPQGQEKIREFAKWGFEVPDFECEILKETTSYLIGCLKLKNTQTLRAVIWYKKGGRLTGQHVNLGGAYNLKPLKKNWWEVEENFPCLVIDIDSQHIYTCPTKPYAKMLNKDKVRPATKEELLSLLVKEND